MLAREESRGILGMYSVDIWTGSSRVDFCIVVWVKDFSVSIGQNSRGLCSKASDVFPDFLLLKRRV